MAIEPLNATLLPALLLLEPAPEPVGVGPEPVVDALLLEGEPVETVIGPEDVAEALLDELWIVSKISENRTRGQTRKPKPLILVSA